MNGRRRRCWCGLIAALAVAAASPGCGGGGGSGGVSNDFTLVTAHLRSGPLLLSTTPVAFLNDSIHLEFSSSLDPASVSRDSVQIRTASSGFTEPARGQLSVRDRAIVFVPDLPALRDFSDAGFRRSERYRIRILGHGHAPAVRSARGRPLPESLDLFFETKDEDPLLVDLAAGPPRVVAIAIDLDGDGTLDTDADPTTPDPEEILEVESFPIGRDVPVGLARRPTRIALLLSEPVLPSSVLRDGNEDRRPDGFLLEDRIDGRPLPLEVELQQGFDVQRNRYFSMLVLSPRTTLPAGALVEGTVLPGIEDLATPPFELAPRTFAFETLPGPETFDDALIESFTDRDELDLSTTAEWDVLDTDLLRAGKGIGGTGVDGPLRLEPGEVITIDTNENDGIRQFTEVFLAADAFVHVEGRNPLRLFSVGDVWLQGAILAEGRQGEDGRAFGGEFFVPAGVAGPGGGDGGRGNYPPGASEDGRSPIGTDGGGQAGQRSEDIPGGGGGGGHLREGGSDPGIVTSGFGGKPYGDQDISVLLGGAGGGAGGNGVGGTLKTENTGGSGGGGGGAVLISTGGTFLLDGGRVSVNGGPGGDGAFPVGAQIPGSGGGGGGSGGSLRIEALRSAEILRGSLNHFGGEGGAGGARGGRPGAPGSKGRLRFYVLSQDREGSGAGKSFALSRFRDTGVDAPRFAFDGSDPGTGRARVGAQVRDLLLRDGIPENATIFIAFQGAQASLRDPLLPDLETVTPLTPRISDLDGYRFIRFRVNFDVGLDIETAPRPAVTGLTIRFSFDN